MSNLIYKTRIKLHKFLFKFQELYTWDRGNQLTYPVRYHEIGYNDTGRDEKSEYGDMLDS